MLISHCVKNVLSVSLGLLDFPVGSFRDKRFILWGLVIMTLGLVHHRYIVHVELAQSRKVKPKLPADLCLYTMFSLVHK